MTWLDAAFFGIIGDILSTLDYFLDIALVIARGCFAIGLGLSAVKAMFGFAKLGEEFFKKMLTYIILMIVLTNYPAIMNKINELAFAIPHDSMYMEKIKDPMTELKNDTERARELNQYSELMDEIGDYVGTMTSNYYFDYLIDETYNMISPNAFMKAITLIFEQYLIGVRNAGMHIGEALVYTIVGFFVLICGSACMVLYCVSMLEFVLIYTVGSMTIGFMTWDTTKFLSENLFKVIISLTFKLIVTTYIMFLIFSGYIELIHHGDFAAGQIHVDQIVRAIFQSFLYVALVFYAPQAATALFTGNPQMGFADVGAALGGMAAAAKIAGGGMKSLAKGGVSTAGKMERIRGSVSGARSAGAGVGGQVKAGLGMAAKNMGDSVKNFDHNLFQSIAGGGSGGGGGGGGFRGGSGGGSSPPSRFSETSRMKAPGGGGLTGDNVTFGEYMGNNFKEGEDFGKKFGKVNAKIPDSHNINLGGGGKTPGGNPQIGGPSRPQLGGGSKPQISGSNPKAPRLPAPNPTKPPSLSGPEAQKVSVGGMKGNPNRKAALVQ